MKLISTNKKAHGLNVYTFNHEVKGEKKEISTMAINEDNARAKAWKRVSEIYKERSGVKSL